jgi:hypothetical protein
LLYYADKSFGLLEFFRGLADPRRGGSIPLRNFTLSVFIMLSTRLGSINRYEKCRAKGFWRRYGVWGRLPGADQLGRVVAGVSNRAIRRQLNAVYRRLKRRKALSPVCHHNLFSLVVDGHECFASYRRCCPHCLRRTIKTKSGERTQYYHRLVMAVLVCERFTLLLDIEMQRKHEDEVQAAQRLLKRLLQDYPRAFDLVLADGLYARGSFFKMLRAAGKHVIAVLKNEERVLAGDVLGICKITKPCAINSSTVKRQVWDIQDLSSWPQVGSTVRVVRSVETTSVKRQSGRVEEQTTHWMWVTTLSQKQLPTKALVEIAHHRWDIENCAFNELVTYWHAGHAYKHDINAMINLWLLTILAYNVFHAFYFCNLKPQLRLRFAKYFLADCLKAELLASQITANQRAP